MKCGKIFDRVQNYSAKANSKSVTLRMSRVEAIYILNFLNFIEQTRNSVFGGGLLKESELGDTPRVLETALSKVISRR